MKTKKTNVRTLCRTCGVALVDDGLKVGEMVPHCGRFHVVGNKKNIDDEKKDNKKIVVKQQKVYKQKIHNKVNKKEVKQMVEKKWQKIKQLLEEGKTVDEIISLTGTKKSYISVVKSKFLNKPKNE